MKITRAYHKTFGCTRFLYNQMLDEKKKNVTLSKFDMWDSTRKGLQC